MAEIALARLKPHPRNYNGHSEGQIGRLMASLRRFGQPKEIVVWGLGTGAEDRFIVAGHGLVEAARRLKWKTLRAQDMTGTWTEQQALAFLAADNELARLGDPDEAALAALVTEMQGFDAELASLAAGTEERLKELLASIAAPAGEDPGAQVDKAEELQAKWQVEPGDVWELGEHRLICGDCTDAAVVARVMGGEKAEMVWTDPPYGVAVGDKNKFLNSIARSNRVEDNLENDTLDEPGLVGMLSAAFDNAMGHCTAGAAWYVAAPAVPLHLLFGQVLKDRGIWRQTIQWVKNNSTFSPMGVCYHWQAEPIFFGWLPNGGHRWYGGRTQTTVWNIDRPSKSPEHPTMKPVELVEKAVENSSKSTEIVYEPFSGSGTTLIACERLGRRCRAVEIEPKYVAVALERWAVMTGREPVRVPTPVEDQAG